MLQNPAQRYEKEMKTNEKIITKYRQYLKLEKSLSENTIQAYLTDLDKLLAYFTLEGIDCTEATLQDLENFSAGLHDIGIHPRSQARILSGIRSFYRFLTLDDYIRQDPSELLESPQIGKHLPDILTVEEIDALIGAIDQGTPRVNATAPFWKPCTAADFAYRNSATSGYPTSTFPKALSKWKARETNNAWYPSLPVPSTS